ncbi:MAG: hypothetical protein ABH886_09005 [Candidatus Desantisbacteria bacterium]
MIEKQIGQLLVEAGTITEEQLQKALRIQKKEGYRLGRVLVGLGFVSDVTMIEFLSHQVELMVERCEQKHPELFQKEHVQIITQKQTTHTYSKHPDLIHSRLELEQDAGKRIEASNRRIEMANESLSKNNYEEVFANAYSAIHHLAQAAKHLDNFVEFREHEMEGMKFVHTGRTGIGQVHRIPVVSEKPYQGKHGGVDKKKATQTLETAQNYFTKVKTAFIKEVQKYEEE